MRQQVEKSKWLSWVASSVIIVAAFAAGVAIGMVDYSQNGISQATVPVDKKLRFDSRSSRSGAIESGWKPPEDWGSWMKGREASILLGFDGLASDDVVILIEARTRFMKGKAPATLSVRFNDSEIGQWLLPRKGQKLRRRYTIPRAVFNRSTAGRLTFKRVGNRKRSSSKFGLEAVELVDARRLSGYRGHVDQCKSERIIGWAVAGDSPVNITATVNGKPLKATFSNTERPDLESHGLPGSAGFELTPRKPIPLRSTIDLRFANGRPLMGSPCQVD